MMIAGANCTMSAGYGTHWGLVDKGDRPLRTSSAEVRLWTSSEQQPIGQSECQLHASSESETIHPAPSPNLIAPAPIIGCPSMPSSLCRAFAHPAPIHPAHPVPSPNSIVSSTLDHATRGVMEFSNDLLGHVTWLLQPSSQQETVHQLASRDAKAPTTLDRAACEDLASSNVLHPNLTSMLQPSSENEAVQSAPSAKKVAKPTLDDMASEECERPNILPRHLTKIGQPSSEKEVIPSGVPCGCFAILGRALDLWGTPQQDKVISPRRLPVLLGGASCDSKTAAVEREISKPKVLGGA